VRTHVDNSSRVAHMGPALPVVTKRSPFETAEQPNSRTAEQPNSRTAEQPNSHALRALSLTRCAVQLAGSSTTIQGGRTCQWWDKVRAKGVDASK
jgi:hypothetical protein